MNYLAHAYFSFGREHILVGNMISDFVKGKKKFDLPEGIQKGITLHRQIDQFTDDHPATNEAKTLFRPAYRLYSGAVVDVLYDHYLANDKNAFPGESLAPFTRSVYETLQRNFNYLPERFKKMLPHMQLYDWLYNYISRWGIEKSLGGLVRRAAYLTDHTTAFEIFNSNYTQLQYCYDQFIKDLHPFVTAELQRLEN